MGKVRWFLLAVIAAAVVTLISFAYHTGCYVGDLRVRTDAMDHGAGYFDILGDGLWHWGTYKAPPTWKKTPPRLQHQAQSSGLKVLAMAR